MKDTQADFVLIDGRIYTMNKAKPFAEAIAIVGERIIKVGSTEEVSYLIGKETKIIPLEGATVVPGFIDTHIHVADFGRFLMWMELSSASSINKMQVMLGERLDRIAKGKWVVGRGWNEQRFTENRLPTKQDLDLISPDNPVLFYHQNGQIALANSKALQLANIAKNTVAPASGFIDVDAVGEPTGILRETATDLVWKLVPEPSLDELVEASAVACEKILASGITSVNWLAETAMDVSVLKRLFASGKLPFDVYMVIPLSLLGDIESREGLNGGARIGCVEIVADGFLASRTAALAHPYRGESQNRGTIQSAPKELATSICNITAKGLQTMVHAMGDKAVEVALEALAQSETKGRNRIDPAALLNPELIQRLREQHVVVSVQPLVAASEFSIYDALEHLGDQRARWLYPLKTLITQGVCVCGGSDCPMEPLSPLLGIQSAVTRRFFPEEQLTVDEALAIYTVNASWATSEERQKGTIEEGKLANLTVLAEDPHEVDQGKIQDISVEMTIVNGKIAYSSN